MNTRYPTLATKTKKRGEGGASASVSSIVVVVVLVMREDQRHVQADYDQAGGPGYYVEEP